MGWRTVSGGAWIVGIALVLYLDGRYGGRVAPFLLLLTLGLGSQSCRELMGLLAQRGISTRSGGAYAGTLAVLAANWVEHVPGLEAEGPAGGGPFFWPMVALAGVVMGLFLGEAARFQQPGRAMLNLGAQLLAVVYVGVLMSFAVALRWAGPDTRPSLLPLVSLLVTAKSTDMGAYAVGRLLGRHPLARILSPRKTIEGAIGGLVGGMAGAILVLVTIPAAFGWPRPGWGWVLGFGFVVAVAAQAGDLGESLLKRDAGRKDSAVMLPGLGGVLDVLDAVLFAAPVAYCFWALAGGPDAADFPASRG